MSHLLLCTLCSQRLVLMDLAPLLSCGGCVQLHRKASGRASLRACAQLHRTKPMDNSSFKSLDERAEAAEWPSQSHKAFSLETRGRLDTFSFPSSFSLSLSYPVITSFLLPHRAMKILEMPPAVYTHTHHRRRVPSHWTGLALFDQLPTGKGWENNRANMEASV